MNTPKIGEVYEYIYDIQCEPRPETLQIVDVTPEHVWYKFPQSKKIFPMCLNMWLKQNYKLINSEYVTK